MTNRHPRKSGQAIIFLMVVLVIGILAVVWNFDLHRVVSAKLRMRNAGDAAALAAARWQGHTLNMIGDLNLIQAALVSTSIDTNGNFYLPPQAPVLHELRSRLEFLGPLAAFAVAQQTAFNNGAMPDSTLSSNLLTLVEDIRDQVDRTPYDNAFDEYADLLENLAVQGVAVSSYGINRLRHPLVQESFYGAVAQALADWWCPFRQYRRYYYLLENYENYESWGKLETEFRHRYPLDLKLREFSAGYNLQGDPVFPDSAMVEGDPHEFLEKMFEYLEPNAVIEKYGDPGGLRGMYALPYEMEWHVYESSWADRWPRPAKYEDETWAPKFDPLAIREYVKPQYNYLGAVAGISMSAPVHRGILSSSDNKTVDLSYKAKAKAFGFLNVEDGLAPPNYFGFVFPCFENVRLVHSDIGDKVLSGEFYDHITKHLEPYLDGGPTAADPDCPYCRLLVAWETLDRQEGLDWLDRAYADDDDNPCEPELDDDYNPTWGDDGGGASGGS